MEHQTWDWGRKEVIIEDKEGGTEEKEGRKDTGKGQMEGRKEGRKE